MSTGSEHPEGRGVSHLEEMNTDVFLPPADTGW